MPTIASSVVPAPQSWDEFEDITLAATKLRWRSDKFQRNGRAGQKQNGVDVFGYDDNKGHIGIQCKNTVSGISIKVIEAEITNAEKFEPPLNQLYIATTAKRDAPLQEKVRVLSDDRLGGGKFCVTILFWEDIHQDLAKEEKVFFAHYPQFGGNVDGARFEAELANQSAMLNEILKRTGSTADAEALGRVRHEVAKAVADNPDQGSAEIVEQVVYLIQSRREALEKLEATPVEDNRVRSFQAAAEQALSNDDDAAAIAALLEAEAAIGERQEIDARARANYTSIRAGLLLGQGDWQAADAAWEQAAAMLMPFDVEMAWGIVWDSALAFAELGGRSNQNECLNLAIRRWQALAKFANSEQDDQSEAHALNCLGTSLRVLGNRLAGASRIELLQESADSYRAVLAIWTQTSDSAGWASTQTKLSITLRLLGERTNGPKGLLILQEAADACNQALTIQTQFSDPHNWGETQHCMAQIMQKLGQRSDVDDDLGQIDKAIVSAELALQVCSERSNPAEWALRMSSLANILYQSGKRTADAEGIRLLSASLDMHQETLRVYDEITSPIGWARCYHNIGIICRAQAQRVGQRIAIEVLEKGVAAFRYALNVYNFEHMPVQWAETNHSLGNILCDLGERMSGLDGLRFLEESVICYGHALRVFTKEFFIKDHEAVVRSLTHVEAAIAARRG